MNSLEPHVTSIIKPLGVHQSQLVSAKYELLYMTFKGHMDNQIRGYLQTALWHGSHDSLTRRDYSGQAKL
jgi:hypothetical protein